MRSVGPKPIGARVEKRSRGRGVLNAARTCGSTTKRLLLERNRQDERAAAAGDGLNGQVAVVHACDLSREPQHEPGALDVLRRLDPAETSEEAGLVFEADADALVDHGDRGHPTFA